MGEELLIDNLQGKSEDVAMKEIQRLWNPKHLRFKTSFKLIITDCSMPFMDGYQSTRIIIAILRAFNVEERPRIVAITGHTEPDYKQKALDYGMEYVYSKPIHSY